MSGLRPDSTKSALMKGEVTISYLWRLANLTAKAEAMAMCDGKFVIASHYAIRAMMLRDYCYRMESLWYSQHKFGRMIEGPDDIPELKYALTTAGKVEILWPDHLAIE